MASLMNIFHSVVDSLLDTKMPHKPKIFTPIKLTLLAFMLTDFILLLDRIFTGRLEGFGTKGMMVTSTVFLVFIELLFIYGVVSHDLCLCSTYLAGFIIYGIIVFCGLFFGEHISLLSILLIILVTIFQFFLIVSFIHCLRIIRSNGSGRQGMDQVI